MILAVNTDGRDKHAITLHLGFSRKKKRGMPRQLTWGLDFMSDDGIWKAATTVADGGMLKCSPRRHGMMW